MAQKIDSPLVLRIPGRGEWQVQSLEEASATYCAERDSSSLGVRDFPPGEVLGAGMLFATISYNGRVWPPEDWHPGLAPLVEAQAPRRAAA